MVTILHGVTQMKKRGKIQPQIRYVVKLTEEERHYLSGIVSKGKSSAKRIIHAQILLKADESNGSKRYSDPEIAEMLNITERTVIRIRKRFVEEGLESSLNRKTHSQYKPRILSGTEEAHLIAVACSAAPEGRTRWTLKLLAEKIVELKVAEQVSATTVGRVLKKMNSSHG